MADKNMSDIIEAYLLQLMAEEKYAEIQRSELARRFAVVPSQINYVINSRFSTKRGYIVQSKRGGGGYIRIEKVAIRQEHGWLDQLIAEVGQRITPSGANEVVHLLCAEHLVTAHEVELIMAMLNREALDVGNVETSDVLRAQLLKNLLNRLRFDIAKEF
ncbi:CtsR family transcriptional regulator [Weissella diestrammenae]|uniref:Transcriptional regulator CtsR n=1 Tax=Weissella diestrammenae TaxID=1162633 RepID=A0A7G9T3G6_9LACO|nr:CtsR family transcriptional regulator [Weissella diestrammenae]MCM0582099.1 CtsR family transcriptional regulator [Weissella diestrammenae]QNN74641.1 CtsR family transcriptional regulator [Weissella diestrammenae]